MYNESLGIKQPKASRHAINWFGFMAYQPLLVI